MPRRTKSGGMKIDAETILIIVLLVILIALVITYVVTNNKERFTRERFSSTQPRNAINNIDFLHNNTFKCYFVYTKTCPHSIRVFNADSGRSILRQIVEDLFETETSGFDGENPTSYTGKVNIDGIDIELEFNKTLANVDSENTTNPELEKSNNDMRRIGHHVQYVPMLIMEVKDVDSHPVQVHHTVMPSSQPIVMDDSGQTASYWIREQIRNGLSRLQRERIRRNKTTPAATTPPTTTAATTPPTS